MNKNRAKMCPQCVPHETWVANIGLVVSGTIFDSILNVNLTLKWIYWKFPWCSCFWPKTATCLGILRKLFFFYEHSCECKIWSNNRTTLIFFPVKAEISYFSNLKRLGTHWGHILRNSCFYWSIKIIIFENFIWLWL